MLTRVQKGSSDFAVYEVGENEAIDNTSLMMINNNRSRRTGLAPITLEELNGRCARMLFDVTGRRSLADYSSQNITQEDFRLMLTNLIDTIEGFDEYMIDVGTVLLEPESVFINEFDHSISFICVALKNTAFDVRLSDFFRNVVQNSRVKTEDNSVSYFNRAWNVITSRNGGFSLRNLKLAMNPSDEQGAPEEVVQPSVQPVQSAPQPAPAVQQDVIPRQPFTAPPAPSVPAAEAVEPVPMPEKEKSGKKSLFGGLFSKDKDKEKESKKKKQPAEKQEDFAGGISGYKNGGKPANISGRTPPVDLTPDQPVAPPPPAPVNPKPISIVTSHSQQPAPQPFIVQLGKPTSQPEPAPASQPQQPVPQPDQFTSPQSAPQPAIPPQPVTPTVNIEEDSGCDRTVIEDDGATKLEMQTAKLVHKVTGKSVEIDKIPFRIGRRSGDVDFCIPIETISKLHATITRHDETYMITDNNSGNHTFLNGTMLVPGKETVLTNNAVIGFYKEEYIFVI